MKNSKLKIQIKDFPTKSGVYFFYDKHGRILYVGKASVLKNRVKSYFVGAHDNKTEQMVSQIFDIKYKITDSVLEAIILEANEIKRLMPKYNIREKDDKSFMEIALTREKFPRFIICRATEKKSLKIPIKKFFGPYTNSTQIKYVLEMLRKFFPHCDCASTKFNRAYKKNQPCIYYSIGLCPAPCVGNISSKEYQESIKNIIEILAGKKIKSLIFILKKQMEQYSNQLKYEEAREIRDRIFALTHINDVALIKHEKSLEQIKNIPVRIEAYDISNLGKTNQVGSMVVFSRGEIDKNQYRKFKINHKLTNYTNRTNNSIGDPQMLAEVVDRRFNHPEWPMPDLIILDGGKGQLSAVLKVLRNKLIRISVIAVAKGSTRKAFRLFKNSLAEKIILDKKFIESIRNEAHRFAIKYHRKLRAIKFTA